MVARNVRRRYSHGEGIATARKAIEYHLPHRLWVIHSDLSKPDFETDIRDWAVANRHLTASQICPIPLSDEQFEDPGTVQNEIDRKVYGDLPENWLEGDVIIDITGGRKQTTAGAFLAALPPGRRLEVNIPEAVSSEDARGKVPGDPVEIEISRRLKKVGRR